MALNLQIGDLKRQGKFAFPVQKLYLCNQRLQSPYNRIQKDFEVCMRLSSPAKWCEDIINGEAQYQPFPNVAWKRPGGRIVTRYKSRNVIAFSYDVNTMKRFFEIGMEPACNCRHFNMTGDLEQMVMNLRNLIQHVYDPGISDQIDWICFQIYKTLLMTSSDNQMSSEDVIRKIAVWLQIHYNVSVNMGELARQNGMSRAKFYDEWSRVYELSPVQYLLDCKLVTASQLLMRTSMPIAGIVRNIHFSGMFAFHRKFFEKFGMTPAEYRRCHSVGAE